MHLSATAQRVSSVDSQPGRYRNSLPTMPPVHRRDAMSPCLSAENSQSRRFRELSTTFSAHALARYRPEPCCTASQATCDQLAAQRAALTLHADELEASSAAGAGEATDQRPDAARAAAALENVRQGFSTDQQSE